MEALEPVDWYSVPDNIPDLPKMKRKYVLDHAKRIKPLLYKNNVIFHCHTDCDYFCESYPWSSETTEPAKDLTELGRIWTLHNFGYYGLFKPSVAEVIMQIPEDLIEQCDFFLVRGPNHVNDLNICRKYTFDRCIHVAQTILFKAT